MASLRPNIDVSPNVQGAATAYTQANKMFLDALDKPFDSLNKYVADMEKQKLLEEERAIRNEKLGWERAQQARETEKYKRDLAKDTATNEALKAIIDPKAYQTEKMQAEQRGIQESLAALSPEERATTELALAKEYRPEVSGQQWLNAALGDVNADQSKLLSTKKSVYDIAVSTPGTPEYEAKVAADRAEKEWAIDLQLAKQQRMEASKEAKEKKALEGLLAGLQTGKTYSKEEVSDTNVPEIEARRKVNADLDKKATEYGLRYKDLLEQDATLAALNSAINKFEEIKVAEGGKGTPLAKSADKGREDLERRRDARIEDLDRLAKTETRIGDAVDVYRREQIPQLFEEKVDVVVPRSKEEWTNAAIANAGPNITTSTLNAILNRAETMYPKADPKEVIKAKEKDQQAKDYRKLIQAITGKPTDLNTVEALESQYNALVKNKPGGGKGVGPQSIGTMLGLGLSDEDISEIVNKAKEKKITDEELASALKTINDSTWTDSGTATDIKELLDSLESKTNK